MCACMNVCIYVCMHECMKNVHAIFFNISRTSLFCSYLCVHNLFTQFAYLMRFRSSTTVLITYVVLFCFLLFEPLFNRSNFTFMLLTHPRRSRDPHVHMYVIFIFSVKSHLTYCMVETTGLFLATFQLSSMFRN